MIWVATETIVSLSSNKELTRAGFETDVAYPNLARNLQDTDDLSLSRLDFICITVLSFELEIDDDCLSRICQVDPVSACR